MKKHTLFITLLLAATSYTLTPTTGVACDYELIPGPIMLPEEGAVDVPTNTLIWIKDNTWYNDQFQFMDEDGEAVEYEKVFVTINTALQPVEPLRPNTTYTLSYRTRYVYDYTTTFTTGEGPTQAEDPLERIAISEINLIKDLTNSFMWAPCPGPRDFNHTLNLKFNVEGGGERHEGIVELTAYVTDAEDTYTFKMDRDSEWVMPHDENAAGFQTLATNSLDFCVTLEAIDWYGNIVTSEPYCNFDRCVQAEDVDPAAPVDWESVEGHCGLLHDDMDDSFYCPVEAEYDHFGPETVTPAQDEPRDTDEMACSAVPGQGQSQSPLGMGSVTLLILGGVVVNRRRQRAC